MTTEDFLKSINPDLTLEIARDFILQNINQPEFLYSVSLSVGLTNQMLADIVGGISAEQVVNFFASSNIDSTPLNQAANLKFMIEEEKMARDLYDALYEETGLKVFDRISDSEQTHVDAVVAEANRLNINISNLELEEAGVYTNTDIQNLYNTLLAQGLESYEGAISVGIAVEETDIVDLQHAIADETDLTLVGVYNNLLNAPYSHLGAFEGFMA